MKVARRFLWLCCKFVALIAAIVVGIYLFLFWRYDVPVRDWTEYASDAPRYLLYAVAVAPVAVAADLLDQWFAGRKARSGEP